MHSIPMPAVRKSPQRNPCPASIPVRSNVPKGRKRGLRGSVIVKAQSKKRR
jgi:hypothetical protein